MAQIEVDSALAALPHALAWAARLLILLAAETAIHVRVDIARPQLVFQKLIQRPLDTAGTEVDHYRDVRDRACLNGLIVREPFGAFEVSALYADDDARILQRDLAGLLAVHVLHILLNRAAAHAGAHNVQQCQNARLRSIDYPLLELREAAPARRAGIHH